MLAGFAEPRVSAQSAPAAVPLHSFEVTSVKPNHSGSSATNSTFFPLVSPHVSATNVTTKFLLKIAYNLEDFELSGAPAWTDSQRYDMSADIDESQFEQLKKLAPGDQFSQVRLLIQSLLADRFKLKITHETKELPVMALLAGKNASSKLAQFAVQPAPNGPAGLIHAEFRSDGQRDVKGNEATMRSLAAVLGGVLHEQVTDRTGISGNYTFVLTWTDAVQANPNGPTDSGPSLQAALEDELGLRLESTKGPVDMIVIDHIEEPIPD